MAHFLDHTATREGGQIILFGICQCGAVQSLEPGNAEGRGWEEVFPGVPEEQCSEYDRRIHPAKYTE